MNAAARVGAGKPVTLPEQQQAPKKKPKGRRYLVVALLVVAAGAAAWFFLSDRGLPDGLTSGNGRLEANEVYVATKFPGRISEVLADEGQTVEAGQIVARMDTETLEAELRQAEARVREAQSSHEAALAQIAASEAEHTFAVQQFERSRDLVRGGSVSEQEAQVDAARALSAQADLSGAQARAVEAESNIEAARAEVERLQADIADSVLIAPLRSRVETRLAEPGEVLDAGGRVLSLIDLSDVYMYIFLPERVAGRIPLGADARIVLDAAIDYPITASVSFVSPMAQFTPRAVETEEERHNLTFRVKLQIPRERLLEYEALVKTGMPGVGYVRYANDITWPEELVGGRAPPVDLWAPTGAAPPPVAYDAPGPNSTAASGATGGR